MSTFPPDAVFESSDGVWTDGTCEIKSRDFHAVLWSFEAYRLKHNKPGVTIVRITPEPEHPTNNADIKWKVPFAHSSGHAWSQGGSLTEGEIAEIAGRADAAYAEWKSR